MDAVVGVDRDHLPDRSLALVVVPAVAEIQDPRASPNHEADPNQGQNQHRVQSLVTVTQEISLCHPSPRHQNQNPGRDQGLDPNLEAVPSYRTKIKNDRENGVIVKFWGLG